ncbi:MAG: hypothetical protein SFY95_04160, partial [Planctomycetota bacterium]|nr:hypothetical protein [Planctomycetota bacterium]
PVWREGMSPAQMPARIDELLSTIDRLVGAGRRVTLGLSAWPREVARTLRVERDDVLGALVSELDRVAATPKGTPNATDIVWKPWVDPLLDKFGQRIERWQLGAVGAGLGAGERTAFSRDLAAELAKAEGYFKRLVPGPVLAVPWRADVETSTVRLGASSAGERGAVISASPETPGPVLRDLVSVWRAAVAADARPSAARPELTIALRRSESGLGPADAAAELVKRAAMIWEGLGPEAGADRGVVTMSLHEPWTISQGRRPRVMPGPELGAWRNLLERLADRRVIGRLPLASVAGPTPSGADGQLAEALILAPLPGRESRGGALIAWNDSGEPAVIDGVLAADPVTLVDIFGNRRAAPAGAEPGSVRIPVGREPVFVEGIDVELVRFRTMLRLDPDRMDAVNREHEHELVIGNPWPTTISGRLTIVEPGGFDGRGGVRDRNWRITPRVLEFSVAPGQTTRLPVKVAFGPGEETGRKKFVFLASVTATRSYPPVYFTQQVELGLPSLRLALTQVASSGGDVIVEAKLTNVGSRVLSVDLTGFAPGQPRQRIGVSGLGPGETATRALHFKGVLATLRGQRVAVSAEVAEIDTGASAGRLNTSIAIE